MKKNKSKIVISSCLIAVCLTMAGTGYAQERKLPDGSIIYEDGTRRLPNGTVIYKGGNNGNNGNNNDNRNNGGVITLPDGSVVYPDGTRGYPNDRRTDRRNNRRNNGGWLPPGQAKKIYGGHARDYAPGQQKKWKDHGRGYAKGKGKGHKK